MFLLDNEKAIHLYESLGFKEKMRYKTGIIRQNGVTRYIPFHKYEYGLHTECCNRVIVEFYLNI